MKKNSRNGFTKAELITVIVAAVVLVALLITTFVALGNQKDTIANINKQTAELSDKIAKLESAEKLTAADVETIVNTAIDALEIPSAGLTEAQVKIIVEAAIAGIEHPEANVSAGLTEAQVKAIVNAAISKINTGLSKAEVEKLIADAIAEAHRPLEDKLQAGGTIVLNGNYTLSGNFGITEDTVLDLNGMTLTAPLDFHGMDIWANVTIKNGTIVTYQTSQINVAPGGSLTMEGVTLVKKAGYACALVNKGTAVITGCTFVNESSESDMIVNGTIKDGIEYPGTMTITDTVIKGTYKTNYSVIQSQCGTITFGADVEINAVRPAEAAGEDPYYPIVAAEAPGVVTGSATINGTKVTFAN